MQTIGERLEDARKKKGISIREAAEATKIRGDYLQKFESNHFDIGLTEIYTRGFLRTYSNFLKLPADRILADFASLGHGEIRPRQPSREVYGRMDITVATAGEASDRAAPPEDTPAENASTRAQPRYPRGGNPNLPTGPDPAVIFKYAKWAGLAVAGIVVLLVLKSVFFSNSPTPPTSPALTRTANPPAVSQPAPSERTITLVALEVVRVNVKRKLPDESEGEDIFLGTLSRGQRQPVPWSSPIYIHASAGQNLEVEFQGKRYPTGFTGVGRSQMN